MDLGYRPITTTLDKALPTARQASFPHTFIVDMLSLLDLEPELLTLILEFVNDASPRSTRAVACVSRYFNEITRLVAHRHKIIDLHGSLDGDTTKLIQSWIDNDMILANIRTLTVKGWFDGQTSIEVDIPDEDEVEDENEDDADQSFPVVQINEATWAPFTTLLRKISRLRRFSWNIKYPLPRPVLDAFEASQRFSTMRIFDFVRAIPYKQELDDIELSLSQSKALTHIRYVEETEHIHSHPDVRVMAFRSIVAAAPNLEYAGFLNRNFGYLNDEAKDVIEKCKAAFYKHKKPNNSVKQLTLDGVSMSMDTLTDWSSIVDLTTIENIKVSRGIPTLDYFQNAAVVLPKLKHLSLNLRDAGNMMITDPNNALLPAIREYIRTCSPLQTLSLWSWINIIPLSDILERHGASLRTLHLHERESISDTSRDILSIDDLRLVGSSCKNLHEFTFDLNRSDAKLRWDKDKNNQYYEELARFPQLASLQIYFDVGASYMFDAHLSFTTNTCIWPFDDHTDNETSDKDEDTSINTNNVASASDSTPHNWIASNIGTSSPSLSLASPNAKRQRLSTHLRPSRDSYLESYVKRIWSTVFRDKTGPRHLDVKVGEWETSFGTDHTEWKLRRHFLVRPHERDDVEDAVVKMHRKPRPNWN